MALRFVDTDYRYGFHVTKHASMVKTVKTVIRDMPLSAIQIYIANSRSKAPPKFDYVDLQAARSILEKYGELYVVIHGCLLYNLAGTVNGKKDDNHQYALSTTLEGLTAELDFGVALGNMNNTGVGVVVHPGSRKDKPAGLVMVSSSIVEVLTRKTRESEKIAESLGITPKAVRRRRKIILENAAGEGSKLCSTLEEIHTVIEGVPEKLRDQVKVCIDTAHAFGKGLYDWGVKGEIARFYDDFDRIIGLEHLEVFHFNDSMKSEDNRKNAPFGSRKDRHQNLGLGYIFGGDERFKEIHTFITSALELGIPVIGEPPGKGIDDWDVIAAITLNDENPLDVRYDPKD